MLSEQISSSRLSSRRRMRMRKPTKADGAGVWSLVRECKPLDENSVYCNLVQCDHFADTCVLAELDGEVVGWISAYLPPSEEDVVFVWQVAVSERARGRGLGLKMLAELLQRPECADVTKLQTTITRDNDASWALFSKLAEVTDSELSSRPYYRRDQHFDGAQATEHLVTIDLDTPLSLAA